MTGLLEWLDGLGSLGLAITVAAAAAFLIVAILILRRGAKKARPVAATATQPPAPPASAPAPQEDPATLRTHFSGSFRAARKALRRVYGPGKRVYDVPLVLLMGPAKSGKTTLVDASGVSPAAPPDGEHLRWSFLDRGVLLEVPGSLLGSSWNRPEERLRWAAFSRQLAALRPELPADGVALVLSARDLFTWSSDDDMLSARARLLHDRLRALVASTGLKLPLRIVVTGCDQLEGFAGFTRILRPPQLRAVLGWTSPYTPETRFRESWVDEAVAETHGAVLTTITRARRDAERDDVAGALRFSRALPTLGAPLRTLLDAVLGDASAEDVLLLRGIYFTGLRPASGDADGATGSRTVAFAHDLVARVLPGEQGLARPVTPRRLARGRLVRSLQVATALLAILAPVGLLTGRSALHQGVQEVNTLLAEIGRDLSAVRASVSGASGSDFDAIDARPLFERMARVSQHRIRVARLPASWITPLRGRVEHELTAALQEIVLPSLRAGLLARARDLTTPPDPDTASAGGAATPGRRAEIFLTEVQALSRALQRFNTIARPGEGTASDLREVVSYVYGEPQPETSFPERGYLVDAVRAATITPIRKADLPSLERDLETLAHSELEAGYRELGRAVEAISQLLASLRRGDPPGDSVIFQLARRVDHLAGAAGRTDPYWLDTEAPPGAAIQARLDSLATSDVFDGAAFAQRFARIFRDVRAVELARLTQRAEGYREEAGHALLVRDGSALRLSPELLRIRAALDEATALSVFTPLPGSPARGPGVSGGRPSWDVRPLDQALRRAQEMQRYITERMDSLPGPLLDAIEASLVPALEERITEALARAMVYEPAPASRDHYGLEEELRARTEALQAAGQRLVQLLDVAAAFQADGAVDRMAQVVILEGLDLLETADRFLDALEPYGAAFEAWDGAGAPAILAAFGLDSEPDLTPYLQRELSEVRSVADRFVRPTLRFFDVPPIRTVLERESISLGAARLDVLRRWQATVQVLDDAAAQKPGNAVQQLERLIRQSLMTTSATECRVSSPDAAAPDVFSRAMRRLVEGFRARCVDLASRELERGYAALVGYHRRALAGRFPFAPPATATPDADPGAVARFFETYRTRVRPYASVAELLLRRDGGAEFARYLSSLETGLALADALVLPPDTGGAAPGSLEVEVKFRTDRHREVGGENVADWRFEVGPYVSHIGDSLPQRTHIWRLSDPVAITLRWADQAPVVPAQHPDIAIPHQVEGRTVRFAFDGVWALPRLVSVLGEPAMPGDPVVLTLSVPLAPAGASSNPAPRLAPARLFLQLTLRHPRTKEALSVPDLTRTPPPFPSG